MNDKMKAVVVIYDQEEEIKIFCDGKEMATYQDQIPLREFVCEWLDSDSVNLLVSM